MKASSGDSERERLSCMWGEKKRLIAPKVYTLYETDKLAFVGWEGGGGDCQWQNPQLAHHATCGPCLEKSQPFWAGQPRVLLQEFECPRRNLPPGVNTAWHGAVYRPSCTFIASPSHVVQTAFNISRFVGIMTLVSPSQCIYIHVKTYIVMFIHPWVK